MAQTEQEIHKLKYPGAIDADGHILESAKCWELYCEEKYRANAIRMKEDADGLEYLEVNGLPSRVNRGGNFGGVAQMGQVTRTSGNFDRRIKYGDRVPLGACMRRIASADSTRRDWMPRSSYLSKENERTAARSANAPMRLAPSLIDWPATFRIFSMEPASPAAICTWYRAAIAQVTLRRATNDFALLAR